jgi:hypothetical protein
MSLAMATKGVISGFGVGGGDTTIAVPVCEPEIVSMEYGETRLFGSKTEELKPDLHGKDLKPLIKISDSD